MWVAIRSAQRPDLQLDPLALVDRDGGGGRRVLAPGEAEEVVVEGPGLLEVADP
jgi:hypothetical protein